MLIWTAESDNDAQQGGRGQRGRPCRAAGGFRLGRRVPGRARSPTGACSQSSSARDGGKGPGEDLTRQFAGEDRKA